MQLGPARVLVVVAVAALAGCGDDQGPGTVDAAPTPTSLIFRLSYQSDIADSIYVQGGTEAGGQAWLTVRPVGGDALPILDDCGVCACADCGACAVCGLGLPVVVEIARGAQLDWIWDASVYHPATCPSSSLGCERAEPLPAGAYLARFCWSWEADGVGTGHHVGPVTCADEPFAFPPPAASPPAPITHAVCACG